MTTTAPVSSKAATSTTAHANASAALSLPPDDPRDLEDAQRGLKRMLPDGCVISGQEGSTPVWSLVGYDFLQAEQPPPSVHPSLWRMAKLNMCNGLFEVTAGVYQVRSLDISCTTIVETKHGLIVIDPLSTCETARAAMELYYAERGRRPVKAVIYTHSHQDHFGGVKGVISQADVDAGRVEVLAPTGFLEAAVSENIYAGPAMNRRVLYQYGPALPRGELGQVDDGLGKSYPLGTVTLIRPTRLVDEDLPSYEVDGITMEFQLVSGTEAPAEMTIYFPQLKLLDSAEIACPLLHNVLSLRGAQVRDAKAWAQALDRLIARYGDEAEVLVAQHNWPRWGRERIVELLANQRDLYEFIHDQSLCLINQGYNGAEVAEKLVLPASLSRQWYTHGYYGTVSHNAKAVYQRYIGWYDGNPANLDPLPPEDAAKKFVDYMGGAKAVMSRAKTDFAKGNYRWVAQVTSLLVFADPTDAEACALEADALEQLGYQAEAGTWRNWYLMGAFELRNGIVRPGSSDTYQSPPELLRAMTVPMVFDYWGVRLDARKSDGKQWRMGWVITDPNEEHAVSLSSSALTHRAGPAPGADLTVKLTRETLDEVVVGGQATCREAVADGRIEVLGNPSLLFDFMGMLVEFPSGFGLVTP